MGTRYEDQPVEQWAGPDSLDPTPVWKQYLLVAVLLLVGLLLITVVAISALAPQMVTPPSIAAGDRLVLSAGEVPPPGGVPRLIGAQIAGEGRALYLAQPAKGDVRAFRARWAPFPGDVGCTVEVGMANTANDPNRGSIFIAPCGARGAMPTFDLRGQPLTGADRGLDQYLVSMSGDRVIVNLSRVIESSLRTSAPVPTGIPQPQSP